MLFGHASLRIVALHVDLDQEVGGRQGIFESMKHTLSRFDDSLTGLREAISAMGNVAKERLERVIEAMEPWDPRRAREIVGTDHVVNAYEYKIGEKCADILTLHHPMVGDLRLVVAAFRIATDLERIGDETEKIAAHVVGAVLRDVDKETYKALLTLTKIVKNELAVAMNCFSKTDIRAFKKLSKEERRTHTLSKRIFYRLIGKVGSNTQQQMLNTVLFTRSLERISDHAMNVSEHVVYLAEGRDIRSAETRVSADL